MASRFRNKEIFVRTDESHYAKWKKQVAKSGATQTACFEKLIDDVEIVNVKQFTKLLSELKRQGNNLNQLARKVNSEDGVWNSEIKMELDLCISVYQELLKAITSAMAENKK